MMGNDLDNSVPPRALVHVSAVFDRDIVSKKLMRLFTVHDTEYVVSAVSVNYFTRLRDAGVVWERLGGRLSGATVSAGRARTPAPWPTCRSR